MSSIEDRLLSWSQNLQLWQRDLLRRIAQGEMLSKADFRDYANEAERIEFAKPVPWISSQSLGESPYYEPLDSIHLQAIAPNNPPVIIKKITHVEGANDLAPGAAIPFADTGLTIVAGRNGSGKSGYIRILKQMAASRGPEKVLPNAFKPEVPKAVISYKVGSSSMQDLTWQSDKPLEASPLQRVRVFDTISATTQLSVSNEVAFIPPTLQILAEYTSSLKTIGEIIKDDYQCADLTKQSWPELEIGAGLELFKQLGKKSGLELINKLKPLSEEDITELVDIQAKLQALSSSDPAKMAIQARNRARQLTELSRNISKIEEGLSDSQITKFITARKRVETAKSSVEAASKQIQRDVVLSNTGSEKWRSMWNAAKEFIEDTPDHKDSDLTSESVCPLCQQPLEAVAQERFIRFADFMKGEAQAELEQATHAYKSNIDALKALPLNSVVNQDLVSLVTTYDKQVGESLLPYVERAKTIRDLLVAMDSNANPPEDAASIAEAFKATVKVLNKAAIDENNIAATYGSSDSNALEASKLQAREQELKMHKQLTSIKSDIEAQHDLIIKINCIQTAAKLCDTTAASKKNTELSKEYVDKVCASFKNEAKHLGLNRVPVKLIFDKSARGVSYIKVVLDGAPEAVIPTVLSEGEQRVVAIAGFFADLTESGDNSALVFDDPVCSLDQSFREAVARRLLVEAKKRQVIVFSHDFTFVQYLYEQQGLLQKLESAKQSLDPVADIEYVHISRSNNGAGELTKAEQWRHVSVGERIKRLNERIQNVSVLHRTGNDVSYEKEARDIVGAIRETWECFVEQELLDGIVKRHARAVETQRLKRIVDICDADVAKVDLGMTIESRWLTGHSTPISDGTQTISPEQLKDELMSLVDFRNDLIERRKRKR